jgi:hypothetical protein
MNEIQIIPYIEVTINKCINDPILIYAFLMTTYKIYKWNKIERPTKRHLILSYLLSFSSRYIFYPLYIFTDAFCVCDRIVQMLSDRDIRIV